MAGEGKPERLQGSIGALALVPWSNILIILALYVIHPLIDLSPQEPGPLSSQIQSWAFVLIWSALWLSIFAFVARTVTLSADGIRVGTLWFGSRQLDWSQVRSVKCWTYAHPFWRYQGLTLWLVPKHGHLWIVTPLGLGGAEVAALMDRVGHADLLEQREM